MLGGCCTLMIGLGAATRDKIGRYGIAYIDGHLDLYDGQTSPSGEAADVPLATMLGHGDPAVLDAAGGAVAGAGWRLSRSVIATRCRRGATAR